MECHWNLEKWLLKTEFDVLTGILNDVKIDFAVGKFVTAKRIGIVTASVVYVCCVVLSFVSLCQAVYKQ